MRMIMNNPPGAGDHHGCPFRSYDADNLRATMRYAHFFTYFDVCYLTCVQRTRGARQQHQ